MGQNWLAEELKRMKEERKRKKRANYDKTEEEQEEELLYIVDVAVRAGIFCLGGLSICFSTFIIPGLVPFLGGLICGVSLIEPPALPRLKGGAEDAFDNEAANVDSDYAEDSKVYNKHSHVMKQVMLNFVEHFF